MVVATIVVAAGALAGLAAGLVVARRGRRGGAPTPDDPHVEASTVRRAVVGHPLVAAAARRLPGGAGGALAEAMVAAALVVVGVGALAGVLLLAIRADLLVGVDEPIARFAARDATASSTSLMRELSEFGGTRYVVVGSIATLVLALRRDRRWEVPVFVVVTMIGQFLVSNCIKWTVDRARPDLSNLTGFAGTSFPSGHAVAGAAVWMSAAFLLGRDRPRAVRATLVGVAVALGVGVAGTRVALGVHWTTDVVAGVVIGWAWFAACAIVFGGRDLRAGEPVEVARDAAS